MNNDKEQMTLKVIHFYFDFISPFAYFFWRKLPSLAKKYKCKIEAHPIVFGKLLDKWGQLGPVEIEPKRKWLHQYCFRYAALNGFEYNPPKKHPFNPLNALRMSLKEVSGNNQFKVIDTIFEGGWSLGQDLGDLATLIYLLEKQSIRGEKFSQRVSESNVKKLLINETNTAIDNGVFGVPTIIIDGNLFWGNDQIEHIQLFLEGKNPLNKEKIFENLMRPRAIDRKVFKAKDDKTFI
ncbi:MAG: hypothetical protein CMJ06_03545 [Pelagibacterales bacterium]|nr:hypothetical protein [Pelagibacterales bacterium]OUU62229.1 MAG: hypothetical protein CBC22_04995 [Alphaproteobacteria bacterium TMED62]|tara:strand:- start:2451 stop:3161 length:711 start_codon:yes stop_codon:yes gene_type:complete